jgi:hypothetical protein
VKELKVTLYFEDKLTFEDYVLVRG